MATFSRKSKLAWDSVLSGRANSISESMTLSTPADVALELDLNVKVNTELARLANFLLTSVFQYLINKTE